MVFRRSEAWFFSGVGGFAENAGIRSKGFPLRFLTLTLCLTLLVVAPSSRGSEYPFTSVDIFSRDSASGSTSYDPQSDTYIVTADGHDIWDTGDDFRFLYVEISGNFSVSVRVDEPAGGWPHSWSKAGIMVRQDLSPGSKDVYLVATRDNGAAFQWRDIPDFEASWTGVSEPSNPLTYPIWLKIVREGNQFTGWYSQDGTSWTNPPQNTYTLSMSNPVLVGICLTSHLSGVYATATFGDFHIPGLEASTLAIAPPDQVVHEGDTVALDGTKCWNASAFFWEQVILGDEPQAVLVNPDHAVAQFVAPGLDVGAVLTFRVTVSGATGKDSATTRVTVKASNAPAIPPGDFRVEPGNLSVTLRWQPMLDADSYVIKRAEQAPGGETSAFQTIRPSVKDTVAVDEYLEEGVTYFYVVAARNSFPPYEGPRSTELAVTGMRNLARRADTVPIALVPVPTGGGLRNLNAIMNGILEENYDTFDDYRTLDEDWFGYAWSEPLFFDHIVYCEGQHFDDGGWWTSLTVQFSDDGVTWKEAPNVQITPPYDFTDSRSGRQPYSRFDIAFKPVRGRRIRIYGSPGGIARFTSIAELEVYGNQGRGPLMVYGVDRVASEWGTALLDASYSFSARGPIVSYHWQQTAGPPVTVKNLNSPMASFVAPGVDEDTLLTFAVTAADGTDTESDEVQVLIRNIATRADAGRDISALENTLVQLDGAASASTSGEMSVEWTQLYGPRVTLSDPHSLRPIFTAPLIWRFSENLVFQLRVDDGLARPDSVGTERVTVCVRNTLNGMPHVEKSGVVIIEAENYSRINRHDDDRGTWLVVEGQPTYVEVPDIVGIGGTRGWDRAAEISYDIKIHRAGAYYVKLRRFVPHGAGRDGGTSNSCLVGVNGSQIISEFDNGGTYNTWVWAPSRQPQALTFPAPGTYSLEIRCREDGYRIDRILLYESGVSQAPQDWSSEVGPAESTPEAQVVCSRELGSYYTPNKSHTVSLLIDVNTLTPPGSLAITEYFPANFNVLDSGGGDSSVPGRLTWLLSGKGVSNRTLAYRIGIPRGTSGPLPFTGYLSYGEVADQEILGQTTLHPLPSAPMSVFVEMLVGTTISWQPSNPDGVVAYHVYRSSDGKNWADISGPLVQSPFFDSTIQPGTTYVYKVLAENPAGALTALQSSPPTVPQVAPYMEIREAEDYNYAGGRFPGGPAAPAAIEASDKSNLDPGVDYFYQNQSETNSYRPQDPVDARPGEGSSGWFMGYSTPGDWWRYTFDVPVAGFVKLVYRGSTNSAGSASLDFLWDEKHVGRIEYNTPGGWRDWRYYSLEPFFTGAGKHVLRMQLSSGNADYDLIALGYDWLHLGRKVIFGDDFSSYSETAQVETAGGWTIVSGSSSRGAWQLWNTRGDALSSSPDEPGPDLPGISGNYVVSNGDFAPDASLDEELLSPQMDCSFFQDVTVQFSSNINIHQKDADGDLQTTDLDLSIYDPDSGLWSDWITVFTHDYSDGDQSSLMLVSVYVSSLADGKRIRLRWRFYNTRYDFWWAIDNVVVSGKPVEAKRVVSVDFAQGDTLSLSWERFGTGYYTVQYTDDLLSGSWTDVQGADWPLITTSWTGSVPGDTRSRFYRVVSE